MAITHSQRIFVSCDLVGLIVGAEMRPVTIQIAPKSELNLT